MGNLKNENLSNLTAEEEAKIHLITSRIMLWIGIVLLGLSIIYLLIAGISSIMGLNLLYITVTSAVLILVMVFIGIAFIKRAIIRMGTLEITFPDFSKR